MLEGVTLLNQIETSITEFNWEVFIVLSVIFTIGTLFLCIGTHEPAFVLFLTIWIPLAVAIGSSLEKEVGSYEKYQVTIDESVSLAEFNKRYEILDQDGLIYTIRERNEGY